MKKLRVYQVDVFTNELFKGNPAGVVANADELTAGEMQNVARELNNPETAFIFRPASADHDIQVRFFTPIVEVPSCGHASVGAGYVWSYESNFERKMFLQKISIGILPLELIDVGRKLKVFMTQSYPEFLEIITGELRERILSSLGLTQNEVVENLPIQCVSTGHGKVIIPIKSRAILNGMKPDFAQLIPISELTGQNGFFVFTMDSSEDGVIAHSRMFAPKIGINEDPVTGNGNGPLGAYIVHHKVVRSSGGQLEFISKQGEAMNRPGYAHVIVDIEDQRPVRVRVGGECVISFKAEMELGAPDLVA